MTSTLDATATLDPPSAAAATGAKGAAGTKPRPRRAGTARRVKGGAARRPSARVTPAEPDASPDDDGRAHIRVTHGDLRFARSHVLVGHYAGSVLVGGEAALDELLDGRLTNAALLGIYPGALETCQVFTDPDTWSTPPGAVVAGLGPIGQLSAAGLVRAVSHATLTAALAHVSTSHRRRTGRRGDVLHLASLLLATGQGGLSVRDSVQSLLTGIARANQRLANTGMGVRVGDVEIVELWQDRALQALEAVRASMRTGELALAFKPEPRLREMPGHQRRLVFEEADGWWQRVRVRAEDDGSLSFEASQRRAGTPTRTVATQRVLVDRLVDSLVDSTSPDEVSAHTLFELLFPNDLKAQAPDADDLVLVVDRSSAHYPWELLDDRAASEPGMPLGVRRGLVRQLEGAEVQSHVLTATANRALVVGDTRSGLAPLDGARAEARAVEKALREAPQKFEATTFVAATGTQVVQALFHEPYRIVHLAGHGVLDHQVRDTVSGSTHSVTGMVLGDDMYLTASEIGQLRQVPELVFVNCCHLGSVPGRTAAAPGAADDGARDGAAGVPAGAAAPDGSGGPGGPGGLDASDAPDASDASDHGPVAVPLALPTAPGTGPRAPSSHPSGRYNRLAASVAAELIDIGVRAVVACGWAVDDDAASTFASTFYASMLGGGTFGDAVTQARVATWEHHKQVNSWGAYQCYGDPDFRLQRDDGPPAGGVAASIASTEQARAEIENLSQSVEVSRNTMRGLERLRSLVALLSDDDLADGALQALIARTYNRFGSYAEAGEHFRRALEAGGTQLTVHDVEVWVDQVVRLAAADALRPDACGTTGTEAPPVDPSVTARAVETIEASIVTLRRLLEDPGVVLLGDRAPIAGAPSRPGVRSLDRLWRVGSAYKRLALVTCPVHCPEAARDGDWSRAQDALAEAATWYRDAYEAGTHGTVVPCSADATRRHRMLANWLAAELTLTWHPAPGRPPLDDARAQTLLHHAIEEVVEQAHRAPTFWSVAVEGDLVGLQTLWGDATTGGRASRVVDLYERAARIGSEEQLRQVRDQVDFLADLVVAERPAHAEFVHAVQAGLARLDASASGGVGG